MKNWHSPAASNHVRGAHTVLSINLCVLVAGSTNRHFPKFLLGGSLVWTWTVLAALVRHWHIPIWIWIWAIVASPVLVLFSAWAFGIALARVIMLPLQLILGLNDYKRERIQLFLRELKENPELASVDVICVQECYSCIFFPGGYPEQLVDGARALGFEHVALPSRCPSWPSLLGQNSGLVILSKHSIRSVATKSFGISKESCSVNRGALYAGLDDGTHVFTCHIAPDASVGGDFVGKLFGSVSDLSRKRQIVEFAQFIREQAPEDDPAIVAGDFNMGIEFSSLDGKPKVSAGASWVVETMKNMCGFVEATDQIRGYSLCTSLQFGKPTYGLPGEVALTGYGNGKPKQTWDDVVFYRGFIGSGIAEIPLQIQPGDRPHPSFTHISDHAAVRVQVVASPGGASADENTALCERSMGYGAIQ